MKGLFVKSNLLYIKKCEVDQKIIFRIRKVEFHFSSFANVHTRNCEVGKWNLTFHHLLMCIHETVKC